MKKEVKAVSSHVFDIFLKYTWPGNIRELENILEYAFIHCKEDILDVHHLPPTYRMLCDQITDISITNPVSLDHQKSTKTPELEQLLKSLENCRWNKTETAKYLNMSRTTLWRMMKRYGLYPPS